jgi:hypothetical protein
MAKPIIKIVNATTGEELEREMTNAEFTQFQADGAAEAERKSQENAKAEAKLAAQAKLAALGLTVEDLQALGL